MKIISIGPFYIPEGRLSEIFGAKYVFGLSIFFSGILTLLIPWASEENPTKLIVLRTAISFAEVKFPKT